MTLTWKASLVRPQNGRMLWKVCISFSHAERERERERETYINTSLCVVLQHFTVDGTKLRQYTIIPTTFNAKEETTFTLFVYSNEKRVTLKAFES